MKPYGDEHRWSGRNSTKTGQCPSKNKTDSRRIFKKRRRAKDKEELKKEED